MRPTRERIEALLEMHHRVTMPDDNGEPYETCDSLGCLVPWPCEAFELATVALEADSLRMALEEIKANISARGDPRSDDSGTQHVQGAVLAQVYAVAAQALGGTS